QHTGDAVADGGKVSVGNVGKHQADPAPGSRAGIHRVKGIVQLLGDPEDALAHLIVHSGTVVQGPGHRRLRHVEHFSDVPQAHATHPAPSPAAAAIRKSVQSTHPPAGTIAKETHRGWRSTANLRIIFASSPVLFAIYAQTPARSPT